MQQLSSNYDAIVVGGGHSGLTAAWYLAKAGLSVLVLERRSMVGGCCVTEEIFPGFRGSSVANASHGLDPGVVSDMRLADFGLRFIETPLGSATLYTDGRHMAHWSDSAKRTEEVGKFARTPRDMDAIANFVTYYNTVAEEIGVNFYESPPSVSEILDRLPTNAARRRFLRVFQSSLADIAYDYTDSPEIASFLVQLGLATNFVGPMDPGSALLLLQRPMFEYSMKRVGRWVRNDLNLSNAFPVGGMGSVTAAMARSAEALGVTIVTEASVARINVSAGSVTGVALTDGREFDARVVVSNASPKTTLLDLLQGDVLEPSFREDVGKLRMIGSSAKVHLALGDTPQFSAATNDEENRALLWSKFRFIPPRLESLQRSFEEARAGKIPTELSFNPISSSPDPSMTPEGKHFFSISVRYMPYQPAEGDWSTRSQDLVRGVIDTLGTHITNIHSIVEDAHVYTPLDLENVFGLPEGNGSHGDFTPSLSFDARPIKECSDGRSPVPGLYMCGVGIWPGNFISGVTGMNIAHRVVDDLASHGGSQLATEGLEVALP